MFRYTSPFIAALVCTVFLLADAKADNFRSTTDEESENWRAIGLVSQTGKGSCTGALIRPDVVLTAAHCVTDFDAKTIVPANQVWFSAGSRDGKRHDAVWAKSIEVGPGYFVAGKRYGPKVARVDLAKVRLRRPVYDVTAFKIADTPPRGADLLFASYASDRMAKLALENCQLTSRKTEFLQTDCASSPGSSGSPYFSIGRDGVPLIVGVHSGRSSRSADSLTYTLSLDHLRSFIGTTGGTGPDRPIAKDAPTPSDTPSTTTNRRKSLMPGGSRPGDRLWKKK